MPKLSVFFVAFAFALGLTAQAQDTQRQPPHLQEQEHVPIHK